MNSGRRVGSARCDVCDGPRRVDAVVLACVARAIVLGSAPSSQMTEVIGRERPLAFSSLEVSGERFACSFLVNVSTVLDTGTGGQGPHGGFLSLYPLGRVRLTPNTPGRNVVWRRGDLCDIALGSAPP